MDHEHLPRLDRGAYQGFAYVHWTMTLKDRRKGWLSRDLHFRFRELLLHALVRHGSICPVYCLMPDHLHMLCIGWERGADQILLVRFLRKYLNQELQAIDSAFRLQKQPHDNVLRQEDRQRDAFQATAHYIAENPVRAGLIAQARDYSFSDSMVPGYPDLDFWDETYWDLFWRIYYAKIEKM